MAAANTPTARPEPVGDVVGVDLTTWQPASPQPLPVGDRIWLRYELRRLAHELDIQAAAQTGTLDDFAAVFDPRFGRAIIYADLDSSPAGVQAVQLFTQDPDFAAALTADARQTVYRTIRAALTPPDPAALATLTAQAFPARPRASGPAMPATHRPGTPARTAPIPSPTPAGEHTPVLSRPLALRPPAARPDRSRNAERPRPR